MARFRDVALVAALFGAAPVLAGTSSAKCEGMETRALSCAAVPATGEVPSTPVAEGAQGLFEALIADFRWGDPEMGAVPQLPVPPPYRMRATTRLPAIDVMTSLVVTRGLALATPAETGRN